MIRIRPRQGFALLVALFLLQAAALLAPVTTAQAKTGGPKTFNLYLRNQYDPPDTLLLANWDALGLDADTPDAVLLRLKQLNPNIKLLAYIPINGTYSNANIFAATSKWREMWEAANTNNWWLRNTQGGIIYDHPGKYTLNLTQNCPQNAQGQTVWDWYPQWITTSILRNGAAPWDGVILDDVWTAIWFVGVDTRLNQYQIDSDRDGLGDDQPTLDGLWRAGNDTLSARVRRLMPAGKILSGNGQNTFYHMNGSFIEAFPYNGTLDVGSPITGYAWNDKMFGPVGYFSNEDHYSASPQRLDVNDAKWATGDKWTPDRTPEFQRHKRFTLASTMLRDGYFAISWQQATQGHNSIWWEAEYDKQIGTPTGAPFQATYAGMTLWRRNYTNGVVLVNNNYTNFPGSLADGLPPIHYVDAAILLNSELGVPDNTPPPAVADLAVSRTWPDQIEVQWTNVADAAANGQCVQLEVRYSASPINDANYAAATVANPNLLPDAPGSTQAFITGGLAAGNTYYFAVKTKDLAGNWSACSNSPSGVTVTGDVTAPAAVTNLVVNFTTATTAKVTWTTTGDDGNTGTAASFDLRYAPYSLAGSGWNSAAAVIGEPTPGAAGTVHSMTLYGMQPSTTYYFGIKVCDEMPNCSALSNTPSATTLAGDQTPPAAISDLRVTDVGTNGFTICWTAPGDDDQAGQATSYDMRFATFLINAGNFTTANYSTSEPGPQRAGTTQFMTQNFLGNGYTYYINLKTADEVPNLSDISNTVVCTTGANPPADATAPNAVADLAVAGTTANTVTLGWTAPGDDGASGTATAFEMRYSTSPITAGNFTTAIPVFGEPLPGTPGTAMAMTVNGLNSGTLYYFALKTADNVGNWSTISNVTSATPGSAPPPVDVTAPSAVANLATSAPTTTSLTVSWTAPGDDAASGTAASYDLRYSTSAITAGNFAAATAVSGEPAPTLAGTAQSMTVSGLSPTTTYYFALKTADEVPNWSGLSNVPSGVTATPADVTAPSAVANLALGSATTTSFLVSWTAPGDDAGSGTATTYDLRYSTSAITAGNFAAATAVSGEPAPALAGTAQSMTVSGLSPTTTYYFALKTADEASNWSTISNVPSATTLTPPDATAPSAVANLALGSATTSSLLVSWTAPGDDAGSGTATTYDLRYSSAPITAANFAAAATVTGEPAPALAGTAQSMTVSGLAGATTYYFALKTADEVPNWSALSNVPSATTLTPPDVTAPGTVTTLGASSPTQTSLLISWTAPGDDGLVGTASQYDLRYSTATITAGNWAAATPVSNEPTPALHGVGQSMTVSGLSAGTTYYFALKTADEVPNWSALSNVAIGTTSATPPPPDTTPPAAVANLATSGPTASTLTLTWSAPGDDGASGTAASYDLRYATATITGANWAAATPVTGEPTPALAGTTQSMTVSGLNASTTYYFALMSTDDAANTSALSNVASGATAAAPPPPPVDSTPPAAVTNLAAGLVVSLTAGGNVNLSWSAPGDDGSSGTASVYDIRYSGSAITAANFAAATPLPNAPTPGAAGAAQGMAAANLPEGATAWFALKTADEAGNWSTLSNVVSLAIPAPADVTPPSAVANLVAFSPTASSLTLSWTSPGDDGLAGTATQYDLRYATTPISAASFAAATPVAGEPTPLAAGNAQSKTVTGLAAGTTYYFALKTADEVPNWSNLSNVTSAATSVAPPPPDTTPPGATSTLAAGAVTTTSVALNWNAPGDDGTVGRATSYDLRYSTALITGANFTAATPASGEPAPGTSGALENLVVGNLQSGTTYYFALKTSDEAGNVSALSNVATKSTLLPVDTIAPAAVSNLAASAITQTTLTLTWTAPGEDGNTGTATAYDIRYATTPITVANFSSAAALSGEPAPSVAGSTQSMPVTGLAPATHYYFALRTADEVPNMSALSNVAEATTQTPPPPPDTTPPVAVTNLVVTGVTTTTASLAWSAPADVHDGRATRYDLRYAPTPLTAGNFAAATPATGLPTPGAAGAAESFTVTGLDPGVTWYFALTASDAADNASALSNVPSATTPLPPPPPDTTPPAAVTTLAVAGATTTTLTVTWTAPGDDGSSGTARHYDLRVSAAPLDATNFAAATAVSGVPDPAEAGTAQGVTLTGLAPGTTWYLALLTTDDADNSSALSNVASGRTDAEPPPPPPVDSTPPAAVALTLLAAGQDTLRLAWSAPGDDSLSGTATAYDLRRAATPLSAAGWDAATPVAGLPAPVAAGGAQSLVVRDLAAGTTYYFALRTRDDAGNWSAVGPSLAARTEDAPPETSPPLSPAGLAVTVEGTTVTLTWQPNGESDLAGYHVYRREDGGAWQPRGTALLTTPGYSEGGLARELDYDYALTAVNRAGQESARSAPWRVRIAAEPPSVAQPQLASAAPNPFVGALGVTLQIPPAGVPDISLTVFDVAGRAIRTLHSGPLDGGTLTLSWDGRDDSGQAAPSGVYLVVLRSSHQLAERKVIRAR